jgi:acetyl-CoA acetyltransferase
VSGDLREVSVAAFAQTKMVRSAGGTNEVELLMPVVADVLAQAGLTKNEIGFTCSGSSDYLVGTPFSFVGALDAVGAWPPIEESHVEMDGAFALYEAWVRLQEGDIDTALVYAFGRSSGADLQRVLALQLDPYALAPLWPGAIELAALQARVLLDTGKATERDFAEVAARSRRDALANPHAQLAWDRSVEELMEAPYVADPLRRHDCPPISDGAAAVVLAAGDEIERIGGRTGRRPAVITGIDHRVDTHALGARDLAASPSTSLAGEAAGVGDGPVDLAELHAPFSHQELVLRSALGLEEGVRVNPSGGALAANPMMVAGLVRIGEAADRLGSGSAQRAVAHATSGPCLQQNLVCVMEARGGAAR